MTGNEGMKGSKVKKIIMSHQSKKKIPIQALQNTRPTG